MEWKFRTLYANEIDCRVAQISEKGLSLLLYKDARVDQNILDETVGAMNWQRHHLRDNANCVISIWDAEKKQWVEKEDTGTESFTEAEKGLASDSFKRAGFNWGIGRELYSAPFIWISAENCNIEPGRNGKLQCYDKFVVDHIKYDENRNIVAVTIKNAKTHKVVFSMGNAAPAAPPQPQAVDENKPIDEVKVKALIARCESEGVKVETILGLYKVASLEALTEKKYANINANWEKVKASQK